VDIALRAGPEFSGERPLPAWPTTRAARSGRTSVPSVAVPSVPSECGDRDRSARHQTTDDTERDQESTLSHRAPGSARAGCNGCVSAYPGARAVQLLGGAVSRHHAAAEPPTQLFDCQSAARCRAARIARASRLARRVYSAAVLRRGSEHIDPDRRAARPILVPGGVAATCLIDWRRYRVCAAQSHAAASVGARRPPTVAFVLGRTVTRRSVRGCARARMDRKGSQLQVHTSSFLSAT